MSQDTIPCNVEEPGATWFGSEFVWKQVQDIILKTNYVMGKYDQMKVDGHIFQQFHIRQSQRE
jgi:hypothetical protein